MKNKFFLVELKATVKAGKLVVDMQDYKRHNFLLHTIYTGNEKAKTFNGEVVTTSNYERFLIQELRDEALFLLLSSPVKLNRKSLPKANASGVIEYDVTKQQVISSNKPIRAIGYAIPF